MLSISKDKTEVVNSRQKLSEAEKNWEDFHFQIDRHGEHIPTGDAAQKALFENKSKDGLNGEPKARLV